MRTCKKCERSYIYKEGKDYTGKSDKYCPECKTELDKKDQNERHKKV